MNWVLCRPSGQKSMPGGEGESPHSFLSFGPWPRLLAEAHSYTTDSACTNIPFRGAEQWPALEGRAAAPNSFPWAVPDIPSFWWEQPRTFGEPGKVTWRADQVFRSALGNPEKESWGSARDCLPVYSLSNNGRSVLLLGFENKISLRKSHFPTYILISFHTTENWKKVCAMTYPKACTIWN